MISSENQRSVFKTRSYTFMVIPDSSGRVRKFVFTSDHIRFLMGVFFLLVFGFVLWLWDFSNAFQSKAEVGQLLAENYRLKQDVDGVRNKIGNLEFTLDRVRNYARKLQVMVGDDVDIDVTASTGKFDGAVMMRAPSTLRMPADVFGKGPVQNENGEDVKLHAPPKALKATSGYLERVDKIEEEVSKLELAFSKIQTAVMILGQKIKATPRLMPILGWVSSSFGYRTDPIDGEKKLHAGVDIVAEPGTPVRSPAEGVVMFSGIKSGYGKAVIIDHGFGISTLFAHNSKLYTNPGVRVRVGDVIAQVGSTGHSTGPHLHYEIRRNGKPLDPMLFISKAQF